MSVYKNLDKAVASVKKSAKKVKEELKKVYPNG
jgi:hypothetical protein